MFNMRLKIGSIRNNEWRCCFCLHVRTATIAFGVWHLLLHILALAVLALVMRNHSYFVQHFEESDFLPTPLSKVKHERPYYLPTTQDGRSILPSDVDMGAILTICTLSITLLMVYGAIKGKPKQILPFFFLQLFDLAITTLTATGYFCYLRSVHGLVAEHWHNLPFRQELLSLSPQTLSLLVLVTFLVSMVWKAYWIGVVWRCYKYLTLKQQATHNTIHYILPSVESDRNDPDYGSLFLDNETALFGPLKQTPPPSYQDVMDEQPPPYPATTTIVQEVPVRRFLFTYTPEDAGQTVGEIEAQSSAALSAVSENVSAEDNEEDTILASVSTGQTPEDVEAEHKREMEDPEQDTTLASVFTDQKPKLEHKDNAGANNVPSRIIPGLKNMLSVFVTNSANNASKIEACQDIGHEDVLPDGVLETSVISEKLNVKEGSSSAGLPTHLSENMEVSKTQQQHDNASVKSADRFEVNVGSKKCTEIPVSVTHSPTSEGSRNAEEFA